MTAPRDKVGRGRIVALAAGGTGGHMFPAQALARELLSRGSQVALITDRRGSGFGADLPEVRTERINAGALAGGSLLKKLSSVGRLAVGYLQARGSLRRLKADTVVGFGGYASVPTVRPAPTAACAWSCTSRTPCSAAPTACWPRAPMPSPRCWNTATTSPSWTT